MSALDALVRFGLSPKESQVYLACLQLGECSAAEIAFKSGVPRTLTYDILERLVGLGLASYQTKPGKKFFVAAAPSELIRMLKEKEQAVRQAMPELSSIHQSKGVRRPRVELFVGKDGMKTAMDSILRAGVKEFLAYGSSRSSFDVIPAFMEQWHRERVELGVVMKAIYNNTADARKKIRKFKKSLQLAEYRIAPIELESPTATVIFGNVVVLQSWTSEPFAVVIHSPEMAENQKAYFKELWKISK